MSATSDIEWTDATWNPVRGCTKVSPGCAHCYAEVFAERFRGVPGHPYEQGFDLRLVPEKLLEPALLLARMSQRYAAPAASVPEGSISELTLPTESLLYTKTPEEMFRTYTP